MRILAFPLCASLPSEVYPSISSCSGCPELWVTQFHRLQASAQGLGALYLTDVQALLAAKQCNQVPYPEKFPSLKKLDFL